MYLTKSHLCTPVQLNPSRKEYTPTSNRIGSKNGISHSNHYIEFSKPKQRMKTLAKLEVEARQDLKDLMEGFGAGENCKIFCCPWLHWYAKKFGDNFLDREWNGVLIMQDWGTVDQSKIPEKLEKAVEYIAKAEYATEPTIKNLYTSKWQYPIWGDNPTWLVTNAVWGLRVKTDKCGYLGDLIHAKAFPTWASVLAQLSQANQKNLNMKVVFAGSWARFGKASENSEDLREFLNNWKKWSIKTDASLKEKLGFIEEININKTEKTATAHFCSHPSVWKKQNCWDGPPSN
jgi:hypothetical protein